MAITVVFTVRTMAITMAAIFIMDGVGIAMRATVTAVFTLAVVSRIVEVSRTAGSLMAGVWLMAEALVQAMAVEATAAGIGK